MLKYLFLLLMLCSTALASLSGSEDDSDPWERLLGNKSESPLRRSPTSVRNLCESTEKNAESSDPNTFIRDTFIRDTFIPDHKNLTIYHDLIKYSYLNKLEITISKDFEPKDLGKVNHVSCYMKIDGKATFARIKSMTGVGKDNSLGDHFDVYQVAVGPLGCKGQATLRIPKLINDLSNQASLTFKIDQKNIHFPLKLESLIYKKPSNEQ